MQILNKPISKVCQAELQALSGSMSPLIYGGVDRSSASAQNSSRKAAIPQTMRAQC
jgi:hypothetical protein